MLRYFFRLHFVAILAVIGSLFGSLLMFLIGGFEIIEAFLIFFRIGHPTVPGKEAIEAVATILSALDSFLLGIIMLYFAYNLYFLLTFPGDRENHFGNIKMPPGLRVETLGQMKKTILIIIVVSLSVFLLRENLLSIESYQWTDLIVPLSIVAIAVAIKLSDFDD
jgi:uncharacterized membrane protein YqhA